MPVPDNPDVSPDGPEGGIVDIDTLESTIAIPANSRQWVYTGVAFTGNVDLSVTASGIVSVGGTTSGPDGNADVTTDATYPAEDKPQFALTLLFLATEAGAPNNPPYVAGGSTYTEWTACPGEASGYSWQEIAAIVAGQSGQISVYAICDDSEPDDNSGNFELSISATPVCNRPPSVSLLVIAMLQGNLPVIIISGE